MSDTSNPTRASAKEIVKQALAAGARGDADAAMSMFSTEVIAYYGESLPYGGTHRGLDAYQQALTVLNSVFALEVQSVTIAEVEHDRVMLQFDIRYTATSTKRHGRQTSMELLTFVDGRVSEVQVSYRDTAALLSLIDAEPAQN